MLEERYPELFRLFGAWLNEDWDFQHETVDAAIEGYKSDSSPEDMQAAALEIDRLLREKEKENWSREQFWNFICLKLGCSYVDRGMTADEWLLWLKKKLPTPAKGKTRMERASRARGF